MTEKNTKQKLLEQGLTAFEKHGFNPTGIQEVLAAVGVPKGSFYHYFKIKQDFGLQVLDFYTEQAQSGLQETLSQPGLSPLERIHSLFSTHTEMCQEKDFQGGCLIGNLSNEMGDICPVFREKLNHAWDIMIDILAETIREAQAAGEIAAEADAHELASFLFNSWQGAMVRMKVTASDAPLHTFTEMVFSRLLPKPSVV